MENSKGVILEEPLLQTKVDNCALSSLNGHREFSIREERIREGRKRLYQRKRQGDCINCVPIVCTGLCKFVLPFLVLIFQIMIMMGELSKYWCNI